MYDDEHARQIEGSYRSHVAHIAWVHFFMQTPPDNLYPKSHSMQVRSLHDLQLFTGQLRALG